MDAIGRANVYIPPKMFDLSLVPRFNKVLSLSPDVFIGSIFAGSFYSSIFQDFFHLKKGEKSGRSCLEPNEFQAQNHVFE